MRLAEFALIAVFFAATAPAGGAEPLKSTAPAPATGEPEPAPRHLRPYTARCAATINVWIEVDNNSLPVRELTRAESKKRVQFHLIGSSPYRGDTVLCRYATRHRDVTTSYAIRCIEPRKERGYRHSYLCH